MDPYGLMRTAFAARDGNAPGVPPRAGRPAPAPPG